MNKIVVIEGIDGSGKSTLIGNLHAALVQARVSVTRFAFPSRVNAVGRLIRDVLERKAEVDTQAMLWLFVAEGVDMAKRLEAARATGVVLVDRHTAISGLIYQTDYHLMEDVTAVTDAARFAIPDRIYILDVPEQVALDRRAARGVEAAALYEPDRIEKLTWMRAKYLRVAERLQNCVVLDGTRPVAALVTQVMSDLEATS